MVNSGQKIVIVTGPESTGKTAIASFLAQKYKGMFLAEYARQYVTGLGREYNYNDIIHIAEYQRQEMEKAFNASENTSWFVDTYLIITKIWLLWHKGVIPEWMDGAIERTKNCLYLLCAPDIDWVADDIRENGGEKRIKLFETYKNELEKYKLSFDIVRGVNDERFRNAVNFVDDYWDRYGRKRQQSI